MKARPKKPSVRGTAARKPAATGKRAAAGKTKATAKPANVAKPAKAGKPSKAAAAAKPARLILTADCTIEHAPALKNQLAGVLADRACVTLDFSTVKRCDTAGLQVLAAFLRERREAGHEVALASLSENFLATVKLLGLAELFAPAAEVSA